MTSATEHLQPGQIDAFADHELPPNEMRAIQQHIAACHPCSLRLLSTIELKQATAAAGRRLDPSAAALSRLTARLQQSIPSEPQATAKPQPKHSVSFRSPLFLWPSLATALLFVAAFLSIWSIRRAHNALSAELLDQHLATLSTAAAPQVLSTDRHTVKPWFEGKLPFSFDLPEAGALPPNTILKGADLVYLGDHPAALLIFAMGKHQVSVFVADRNSVGSAPDVTRSGYNLRFTTAGELRLIAVGDVDPSQLDHLLASLTSAQR